MTPNNLVNMSVLNGLDIIALTDHNSCKNCPAAAKAAEKAGILFVPGMELCTSEEAHVICLFPSLIQAIEFDAYVEKHIPPIANNPDVFGEQQILDCDDEPVGIVGHLLITATDISVDNVVEVLKPFGGAAFPAHIDKSSYSVISSLGIFPDYAGFSSAEISPKGDMELLKSQFPILNNLLFLHNSDAHYLENIAEAEHSLFLPEDSAEALIQAIKQGVR